MYHKLRKVFRNVKKTGSIYVCQKNGEKYISDGINIKKAGETTMYPVESFLEKAVNR